MQPLSLDDVLTFRPGLRAEPLNRDLVFVVGERERYVLSSPHMMEVARLVDGKRAVHDVLQAASGAVSEAEALYILDQLVARGYLVSGAPSPATPATAAFWGNVGLDARRAMESLRRAPVSLRCIGDARVASTMAGALEQAGLRVVDESTWQVVVTDDYLRTELASIDADARRRGAAWFAMKVIGTRPLIGPLFQPSQGPCWECLAFWMRSNRPVEEMLRRVREQAEPISPPDAANEASVRTACGMGALAMARALASDGSPSPAALRSTLIELDLASFAMTSHPVVRRPQCPACGDARQMAVVGERRLALQPVRRTDVSEGGHRQYTPRKTYERYQHLVSPMTGAVSYVVPVPGRDTETRAVYASGYLTRPPAGISDRNVFDRVCAGKGRSTDQARVSALCEALERYSGVYQGDEARLRASAEDLGDAALPPSVLLNFSEQQHRVRDRRSDTQLTAATWVPEPLDRKVPIDWTPAWSLTRDERRYVPFSYCFAEAPAESGTAYCQPCGNGVAAGTCLEEAILQGLLELVERDAVGIWWYNRAPRPAVDVASFQDSYFDSLRADYARLGWKMWVLDLTHDLGIPVCAALAHEGRADRFSIGFGCHIEPRLAVERALTELNQLFEPGGSQRAPWDVDRLSDRRYLFPRPDLEATTAEGIPRMGGSDLLADLRQCQRALGDAGLEVVVVDKTRPDIGLNVAQVVAPGLRHVWPRFGPGRLYTVPHALGWVPHPLPEAGLNPVPLFV